MSDGPDRRRAGRRPPDVAGWSGEALLRPGLLVRIVNIGPFGVLVESTAGLRPGRHAELQLMEAGTDHRVLVPGRVERCQVIGLQPLSFRGAIAFEDLIPLPVPRTG